ncbi:MAG: TonB-dependent receptor plug domain-containing protein, partial [Chloroflexota bacterium]
DGDALQRASATNLGETLKDQLGVSSSSFGPGVGVPVIRGLSGNRLAILQNSSPLADASATSPDHAIAQEPLLADRIEILRGPATLRFGPGAIGGVVNIIDNRIHLESFSGAEGALETRHDSNNDGNVVVGRLDAGTGLYSAHVSAMTRDANPTEIPGAAALNADDPAETTHGTIANSEMEADAFSLGVSRTTDNLAAGFGVSHVKNDYGIPPGAHHHEEEENHLPDPGAAETEAAEEVVRIAMEQTEFSGKLVLPQLPGPFSSLFRSLFLDASHTDYEHTEFEITGELRQPGTAYETDTDYARLELTFGSEGDWQGYTGAQIRSTSFLAIGDEAFIPENETALSGVFATVERPIGDSTLEFGARLDRQTADPVDGDNLSHNLLNASASYLYPLDTANSIGVVY